MDSPFPQHAVARASWFSKRLLLAVLGVLPLSAHAQEADFERNAVQGAGFIVELGGAGSVSPSYEGSSQYSVSAFPIIRLEYLRLPNGFQIGGGDGQGWSFRPSIRYKSKRSAADYPELTGLPTVKASLELGGGVAYRVGNVRAFVDMRYGVTGHNGFLGESGIDLIMSPMDRLTLSAGPRLNFADQTYMNTYFGVSAAGAAASGLPQFSPSGGFRSAGLATMARYEFGSVWAVEGTAAWNRMVGDAAASPIVAIGSRDQFSTTLGITRKFKVDF